MHGYCSEQTELPDQALMEFGLPGGSPTLFVARSQKEVNGRCCR